MLHFSRGATALNRVNSRALMCDSISAYDSFSGNNLFHVPVCWNIIFFVFLSFQAKKVNFFQKFLKMVIFFTINHRNTLKENEIHNINHCKFHIFSIMTIQKSSVILL